MMNSVFCIPSLSSILLAVNQINTSIIFTIFWHGEKDLWIVLDVFMKVPEDPDVQYDQTGLKARKTLKDSAGPFT